MDKCLFGTVWITLLGLCLIPAIWPAGAWIEKRFFPVWSMAEIDNVERTEAGVRFFVSFEKYRDCQFLGVAWYNGPVRVGVELEPGSELLPRTRPTGEHYAGPWTVQSVDSLRGTHAVAIHRCHPLWETISPFYRGDMTTPASTLVE